MGAIIGWVLTGLSALGAAVAAGFGALWAAVVAIYSALQAAIAVVATALASLAKWVYRFAETLWSSVLQPLFDTLTEWWRKFSDFLHRVIDPILDRLEWVHDLIIRVYDRFVAPVLQWIERARLIFAGLALLGVDFARRIADVLAQVEQQVNQAFERSVQYLYQVTNIINDLLSVEGWFKGRPFLLSVYRWRAGLTSIMIGAGIDPFLEARRRARRESADIPTLPMVRDRWTRLILHEHVAIQRAVAGFKAGQFKDGTYRGGP